MDSLHSSSYYPVLLYLYQSFGDCTQSTNYDWYHRHFHVPYFFNCLARSRHLSYFLLSFSFTQWSARTAKSTIRQVSFLLLAILRSGRLGEIRWSFVPQNPWEFCVSHFPGQILGCVYTICALGQILASCTIPSKSPCPPSNV